MGDLDDKLREILASVDKAADLFGEEEWDDTKNQLIAQIKQVFEDAGYRKKIQLVHDDGLIEEREIYKEEFVPTNQPTKMTGAEWEKAALKKGWRPPND